LEHRKGEIEGEKGKKTTPTPLGGESGCRKIQEGFLLFDRRRRIGTEEFEPSWPVVYDNSLFVGYGRGK
jgi:hypothetical protein